jgi:hypothetical protein
MQAILLGEAVVEEQGYIMLLGILAMRQEKPSHDMEENIGGCCEFTILK